MQITMNENSLKSDTSPSSENLKQLSTSLMLGGDGQIKICQSNNSIYLKDSSGNIKLNQVNINGVTLSKVIEAYRIIYEIIGRSYNNWSN